MVFNSTELNSDFNNIYKSINKKNWKKLNNSNFLLTGCTGPFGFWLINSIIFCKNKLNLNLKIYVLSRRKNSEFIKRFKEKNFIKFIHGDIRNFKIPTVNFDYVIHGATTSALETFLGQDPLEKYSVIVDGMRNLLNIIKKNKTNKILFLSSGSVYGNSNKKISEDFPDAFITNDQNFDKVMLGEAKRSAEVILSSSAKSKNFEFNICRCFTFAGPYMPLNIHYVFGNFIKDALKNKNILIKGNPKTMRSFMSFSDLTIALWSVFFFGRNKEIYNIGSEKKISILNLAKKIKKISNLKKKIIIKKNKTKPNIYLPSIKKIKNELKFKQLDNLDKLIKKTILNVKKNKKFYGLI